MVCGTGGVIRAVISLQQSGSAPIPGVVCFSWFIYGDGMDDLMRANDGRHIDVGLGFGVGGMDREWAKSLFLNRFVSIFS